MMASPPRLALVELTSMEGAATADAAMAAQAQRASEPLTDILRIPVSLFTVSVDCQQIGRICSDRSVS
jgi:hypothetical protein